MIDPKPLDLCSVSGLVGQGSENSQKFVFSLYSRDLELTTFSKTWFSAEDIRKSPAVHNHYVIGSIYEHYNCKHFY